MATRHHSSTPPTPGRPRRKISEVIERRLQSGSIFSISARAIPLREPDRWSLRMVNSKLREDRLWEIQQKGWSYASVDDLAVRADEVGLRELEGRLVRGDRGEEVLMKMTREDYQVVQAKKDTENRKTTFGAQGTRDAILTQADSQLGDQATEYLRDHLPRLDLQDSRELVKLDDSE